MNFDTTNNNNRITTANFSYTEGSVNAGNLTANGSGTSYTYNQENLMTAASSTLGNPSYVVDAEGRRVKKTIGGTTTDYFYAGSELIAEKTGAAWKDYIFFGGQRMAEQTGTTASTAIYLHTDHLGSTRRCTDANGASAGTCDYEPFGENQPSTTCSVPTRFRFAGMEFDSDTALYHTWFREYDPNQGRWMSVDPLAGREGDPQTHNRYVYVGNDPVNFLDPLGLCHCTTSADGIHCDCDYYWVDLGGGGGGGGDMISLQHDTPPLFAGPIPGGDALGDLLRLLPPPPVPPPPTIRKCAGTARFSAVGPQQASGHGALAGFGVPGHQPGTVAVSPAAFGLTFPEPAPGVALSPQQLSARISAQRQLAGVAGDVIIAPQGLNLQGGPSPPYTVSDIGDRNIRTSSSVRFDVYGFPSQQAALRFGIQNVPTIITIPISLRCPPGFLEF